MDYESFCEYSENNAQIQEKTVQFSTNKILKTNFQNSGRQAEFWLQGNTSHTPGFARF